MFEIIPRASVSAKAMPPAEVHLSSRRAPSDAKKTILVFALGREVQAKLGWEPGSPVEIAWGKEKNLGQVRLAKAAGGGRNFWKFKGNKAGTAFRVFTASLPETFSGSDYDGIKLAHEIIPSSATAGPFLVVDLPKGFHVKK